MQQLDLILAPAMYVELSFDAWDADAILQPGPADETVRAISEMPYMRAQINRLDPEDIRLELKSTGGWDETELQDDEENVQRLVWILGCATAETELCDCGESPDTNENTPHSQCYSECDDCGTQVVYTVAYCDDCAPKHENN